MKKGKKEFQRAMVVSIHHTLLDKSNKVRTSLLQQENEVFGQSAKNSFIFYPQSHCHRGAVRRALRGLL